MTYFAWNTKTGHYNLHVPQCQFVVAAEWLRSKQIRFTSYVDRESDTASFSIKRKNISSRWINALSAKHGKKPVTQYTNTTRTISRIEWQRRFQFVPNSNQAVIRSLLRDNSRRTYGFSSISEIASEITAHLSPPKPQVQAMATHNDDSIERNLTDTVSGGDVGASDTKASQQAIAHQLLKPKSIRTMTWDELHCTCLKHGIDPNLLKGSKRHVVKVQMKAALRSIGITKA